MVLDESGIMVVGDESPPVLTKGISMFVKFSPPTHHDKEPYGTICWVFVEEDVHVKYVQESQDPDNPDWKAIEITRDLWGVHYNS